jgi:hypothetical protein
MSDTDPIAQGDYMVAVGIYPPNFKDYSTMYKYLEPGGRMPTDVVIRHEINRYLHHTNLIGHHYSTCKYRRNGAGKITCDDLRPDPSRQSYAGEISDMAFVVHGVKDDSLAELVIQSVAAPEVQTVTTTASSGDSTHVVLLAENQALREDLAKLTAKMSAKENSYAEEIEQLKEQLARLPKPASPEELTAAVQTMRKAAAEEIDPNKPLPALEKVHAVLTDAGKSVQLGVLAADLGVNKKLLRSLLETDPKIKIAPGGLAWVSLAA